MSPICEVAIRHGEGTHLVTFEDGESFAMCSACADDALVATANVKVERIIAERCPYQCGLLEIHARDGVRYFPPLVEVADCGLIAGHPGECAP